MYSSRGSGGGYSSESSRRRGQQLGGKAFSYSSHASRSVVVGAHSHGGSGTVVFVGNLPWDAVWQELKDLARSQAGIEAARADVPVNDAGRSRGFGILEFASASDAAKAISSLNGIEFKGRVLEVREDRRGGQQAVSLSPQHHAALAPAYVPAYAASTAPAMGMMTMMMQPPTNTRVFVSNLAYEVQWQDLKDLMKRVGTVVRADVFTDASGRSKGNGVVEFSHPAEAALAIQTLNNADLRGRPVLLREDRPPGGAPLHHGHVVHVAGAQASSAAGSGSVGTRVYIGNLAWDVAWQDLKDHIRNSGFPSVMSVDVLMEGGGGGRSKGCAIAQFPDSATAAAAIQGLNNTSLHGRQMFVREDREEGK